MFKFWMTTPYLDTRIPRECVKRMEREPTLHYYGEVDLTCEIDNPEDFGLYPRDEESEGEQAEAGALYRSEMGYRA